MKPSPHIQAKDLKVGDVLEIDLHVMVNLYGSMSVSTHKWNDAVYVGPAQLVFTVPEGFNPAAQAVAAIDKQLDTLADEYQKKKAVLTEKKAQLLQISYGGNDILDAVKDPS